MIKLELSIEEVNAILQVLGDLPTKLAFGDEVKEQAEQWSMMRQCNDHRNQRSTAPQNRLWSQDQSGGSAGLSVGKTNRLGRETIMAFSRCSDQLASDVGD
jgi:hypothetical protein